LHPRSAGEAAAGFEAPRRGGRDALVTASSLVLLGALATADFGRGAYFTSAQWAVAALLAIALAIAVTAWPFSVAELRSGVVPAGALLAAWALLRAALAGTPTTGLTWALFGAGTAAVVSTCRRLSASAREMLLGGAFAVGIAVAATGWAGVAMHLLPWGLTSQGLWRAASTLTYPNATAALLVPLALVGLSRLAAGPRSAYFPLLVAGLLVGAGATLSRAGAAAFAVGFVVLCCLQGVRAVLRATVAPAAGAVVALLGLVPSLRAAGPARPLVAAAALLVGLLIVVLAPRVSARPAGLLAAGAAVAALLVVFYLAPGAHTAARALAGARFNLTSPNRSGEAAAALRMIGQHPLVGAGPGHAILRWTGADGGLRIDSYSHDEYLQVLADLGAIGMALLVAFLAAIGRLLWRARLDAAGRALWAGAVAGVAAFAVQSGFDFLWQVPAVPLTVAVLVGLAAPVTVRLAQPAPAAQRREKERQ
jgi:O-Antigen ligase